MLISIFWHFWINLHFPFGCHEWLLSKLSLWLHDSINAKDKRHGTIDLNKMSSMSFIHNHAPPKKGQMGKLTDMMCSETRLSRNSSGLSSNMKTRSNRERSAALIFKFSFTVFARLQFGYLILRFINMFLKNIIISITL